MAASIPGSDVADSLNPDDDSDEEMIKKGVIEDHNDHNIDHNGFYSDAKEYTDPMQCNRLSVKVIRARELKWREMCLNWPYWINKKYSKVRERCRKGIPSSMRGDAWQFMCNSPIVLHKGKLRDRHVQHKSRERTSRSHKKVVSDDLCMSSLSVDTYSCSSRQSSQPPSLHKEHPLKSIGLKWLENDMQPEILYEEYLKDWGDPLFMDQIMKDIHRQFPFHEMFVQNGGDGQLSLRNILKAYTVRHNGEGYCQGQAPLAAVLLMFMPELDAFWTYDRICTEYLKDYFIEGLAQVQIDGEVLYGLLKKHSSSTYKLLQHHLVEPIYFVMEWFMCVYIRSLPWSSVLRILDIFLLEGKPVIFKVGLVLLIHTIGPLERRKELENCEDIVHILHHLPAEVTSEKFLIREVCRLPLTNREIEMESRKQLTKWQLKHPHLKTDASSTKYSSSASFSPIHKVASNLSFNKKKK